MSLLPLGLQPPVTVPDDAPQYLKDLTDQMSLDRSILVQNMERLNRPAPVAAVKDEPMGHGLAENILTHEPMTLLASRYSDGLQLANGADRGKVTISFNYLGVGPVVVGSGASVTYTADFANTVGGPNGLDTGSEANSTWYYVFIIVGDNGVQITDNTANNNQPPIRRKAASVASLLSVSAAPKLPPGYTRSRRVGMVYNNSGGNLYRFTNAVNDDWFWWNEDVSAAPFLVLNVTTSAVTFTDVSCATVAPPTCREVAMLGYESDTPQGAAMVKNKDHGNVVYALIMSQVAGVAGQGHQSQFTVGCDSAQAVQYRSNATTNDVNLSVLGYKDLR